MLRTAVMLIPLLVMLPYTLGWYNYDLITWLEQRVYDRRMLWLDMRNTMDERVVIVDVDENSLVRYGRWPWHRDVLAKLAKEVLQHQRAAVLGFDVLLAEPDHAPHAVPGRARKAVRRNKQQSATLMGHDTTLADQLYNQPVVLGFWFSPHADSQIGALPRPLNIASGGLMPYEGLSKIQGYTASLPLLVDSVPAGGFLNAITDIDGEVRSIPLLAQRGEGNQAQYYPALSLAMLLQVLNNYQVQLLTPAPQALHASDNPMLGIVLSQGEARLKIPTDENGAMLIPFRARRAKERFRYVSAADVLDGKLAPNTLTGRMVLVGTTAAGLRDFHATPVGQQFPGVEVHAAAISAMLEGDFIYRPDYAKGFALLMELLAVLVLMAVLPRVGTGGAMMWCLGLIGLMVGVNAWVYAQARVVLPLATAVLVVLMTYVVHVSYGFFFEKRAKKQLASLFGYYVPAELVSEMMRQLDRYDTKAQSREMTMMFCDIQDFTHLAEGMEPQQVQTLLNRLFDRMTEIVAKNHGTVDKYIGDCLMVFWGAPVDVPEHAQLAVKAACEIVVMLQDFNREQAQLGLAPIQVSIGINTGVVSVGDMGATVRRSYTVLGDAVNLTARLEPLGKYYGVLAAVGERTVELAPQLPWQWVDTVRVAGKQHAVNIYTPLDVHSCLSVPSALISHNERAVHAELEQWQRFCAAYHARQWDEGLRLLEPLLAKFAQKKLYTIYQQRLQQFLKSPPPADWDGVTDAAK